MTPNFRPTANSFITCGAPSTGDHQYVTGDSFIVMTEIVYNFVSVGDTVENVTSFCYRNLVISPTIINI